MPKRILLVDDNEDKLLIIWDRLESMGLKAITALHGVQDMEMVQALEVNGILLDLEMPLMKGLTMLSRLKQRFAYLLVIVMSEDHNKKALSKALIG